MKTSFLCLDSEPRGEFQKTPDAFEGFITLENSPSRQALQFFASFLENKIRLEPKPISRRFINLSWSIIDHVPPVGHEETRSLVSHLQVVLHYLTKTKVTFAKKE